MHLSASPTSYIFTISQKSYVTVSLYGYIDSSLSIYSYVYTYIYIYIYVYVYTCMLMQVMQLYMFVRLQIHPFGVQWNSCDTSTKRVPLQRIYTARGHETAIIRASIFQCSFPYSFTCTCIYVHNRQACSPVSCSHATGEQDEHVCIYIFLYRYM